MSITYEMIKSWKNTKGNVNSMDDIFQWIEKRNSKLTVNIEKVDFSYDGFWYYDEQKGYIKNKKNSFFQLAGYQEIEDDQIVGEQPIIIQDEIGYLGIICKMIEGTLHFLMQAKVEPGNVNVIQISPTIQATKSNFTRQHGGNAPSYLKYFDEAKKHKIIVDQLQSEQSSRFYKKRNRNIIILVEKDIEVVSSHMWMTLGQIKECMKIDNLVNMDTRTVLSCIPFSKDDLDAGELEQLEADFNDKALFHSIFKAVDREKQAKIFNVINDRKMYRRENSRLLPLKSMKGWQMNEKEIICRTPYDFKVIYCRIEIEGREVKYWEQPLIEALGMSVIGIFTTVENGVRKYLVRVKQEMGCFDSAEVGPIMQLEPTNKRNRLKAVEKMFLKKMEEKSGIKVDVILSEEGGRFYHEQNRNVIIEVDRTEVPTLPEGYFWVDYATLNNMIQFNNCVNIQLRNLMALIEL
ncbi:MAG: NDP-hexose 2,3-dehydratase family protein [Lachnospiraceae bacterium]|nr:NDP-hexose 2,3-dehydratase family protein [Lachnospiraceae bacterium]